MRIAPGNAFVTFSPSQTFTPFTNVARIPAEICCGRAKSARSTMNFGLNVGTRIFGMYTFKKKSLVQAIRHEIRPNISVAYTPDMNRKSYYTTQIDTFGTKSSYSYYQRSVFGAFGQGRFGVLNFGIDNVLQMKVRNKKDTSADAVKKITLLDGLNITGSYNFLVDSFKLSPFNIALRTNLFEKISLSAGAVVTPYLTDYKGDFINKYVWTKKVALGKITSGNIALQSTFKGGDKKEKLPVENLQQNNLTNNISGQPLDEYQQEAAYIRNNPGEFANFNIPWSISIQYALNYQRIGNGFGTGYVKSFSQNINWSGTLNLTSRWQIGLNGSYNITLKQLGLISMSLSREMHCWQMNISMQYSKLNRSFSINISPKSGLLRDLKINRTRYFYGL